MAKRSRRKKRPTKRANPAISRGTAPLDPRPVRVISGPWGEVETYETFLEAPDALLDLLSLPSKRTVWNFFDMKREEIIDLFFRSGIEPVAIDALSSDARWKELGRLTRIFPTSETVHSLSPSGRIAIYRMLAQWEENPAYRYPIVLEPNDCNDRFAGLPESVIGTIANLRYRSGNGWLFSDIPLLLGQISHPATERNLLRVLTRTRTLLARLRIDPEGDIERISRYWSADGQNPDPLPILQSIALTEGVETIDIAHLMPAASRDKLYNYPSVSDVMISGRAPDGLWSAFNFHSRYPLPVYHDCPGLSEQIGDMFTPLQKRPAFGDLLLISDKDFNRPCHACVAVAGDIVYTKNSASFFSPWILSTLNQVIQYHVRSSDSAIIRAYRKINR